MQMRAGVADERVGSGRAVRKADDGDDCARVANWGDKVEERGGGGTASMEMRAGKGRGGLLA